MRALGRHPGPMLQSTPDGSANLLGMVLPAGQAAAAARRINHLAHLLRRKGEARTSDDNLGPMCRHDHTIRHRAGRTYQRLPNGDHLFITPLGCRYTTSGRPP